jgi:hypothetical protein
MEYPHHHLSYSSKGRNQNNHPEMCVVNQAHGSCGHKMEGIRRPCNLHERGIERPDRVYRTCWDKWLMVWCIERLAIYLLVEAAAKIGRRILLCSTCWALGPSERILAGLHFGALCCLLSLAVAFIDHRPLGRMDWDLTKPNMPNVDRLDPCHSGWVLQEVGQLDH